MPFIGTSTTISSLSQLESLDSSARWSVQSSKEGDVIVATKGTLADGLYSLRAAFCPNQTHTSNIKLISTMKEQILSGYSESDKSIFENHLLNRDPTFRSKQLILGSITTAKIQTANKELQNKKLQDCVNEFKEKTLPQIKMVNYQKTSADNIITTEKSALEKEALFDRDLKKFLDNTPRASLEQLNNYLSLYSELQDCVNEFKEKTLPQIKMVNYQKTSADNIITTEKSALEKEALFDRDLKNFLDNTPRASLEQLNNYLSLYSELQDCVNEFKEKTLPQIKMVNYQKTSADDIITTEKSTLEKEALFDRDLKNFLDNTPLVSSEQLTNYLDHYSERYSQEHLSPSSSNTDQRSKIFLTEKSKNSALTMANNPVLRGELTSLMAEGNPPQKVFDFLAKLFDTKTPIKEKGIKIDVPTRIFFIQAALANSTIHSALNKQGMLVSDNPETFQLAQDMGRFLASPEKSQEGLEGLQSEAKQILEANQDREKQASASMSKLKEKVEAYQNYAKAERAAGRTPEPMKPASESDDAITQPLLQPPAIAFLQEIIGYKLED